MAELKVEGIESLLTEVEQLGRRGARIENKALREAGDVIKSAIESEAPIRSGTLKKSITVSRVKTTGDQKRVEIGPDKDGWYGKFVEFGTVKMKANPFMARGYETSKSQAMAEIKKQLKQGLGL
ncbi:HK97 gp10 family phage protein [Alkalihalobacillus oceani]|uniref:HK97-gp10 family putative phage morphogenesis protein n=1 Tax=Halalkalibacter oceani TaxID=1653776 RepID=UPI00203FE1CF|nr:HK97 gp10 family phage protein [Halalkalibacter oceani]